MYHYKQCFQNQIGHGSGKITSSRFTGWTDGRTAVELVT